MCGSMKATDWLIGKCGYDKLLHFLLSAWTVAIGGHFSWWLALAVFLVIITISIIKEVRLDVMPDWLDVSYATAGGLISLAVSFI